LKKPDPKKPMSKRRERNEVSWQRGGEGKKGCREKVVELLQGLDHNLAGREKERKGETLFPGEKRGKNGGQ